MIARGDDTDSESSAESHQQEQYEHFKILPDRGRKRRAHYTVEESECSTEREPQDGFDQIEISALVSTDRVCVVRRRRVDEFDGRVGGVDVYDVGLISNSFTSERRGRGSVWGLRWEISHVLREREREREREGER